MDNMWLVVDKPSNAFLGMAIKFVQRREDEKPFMTYKFISYVGDMKTFLADSLLEIFCVVRRLYPNAIMLDIIERETLCGSSHKFSVAEDIDNESKANL